MNLIALIMAMNIAVVISDSGEIKGDALLTSDMINSMVASSNTGVGVKFKLPEGDIKLEVACVSIDGGSQIEGAPKRAIIIRGNNGTILRYQVEGSERPLEATHIAIVESGSNQARWSFESGTPEESKLYDMLLTEAWVPDWQEAVVA
ncbi:hypothetical protein JNK13_08410 [bacterium]|nr:hypothetical protein [bacterium]